jgi:lipopolysaccharide export system permease protein
MIEEKNSSIFSIMYLSLLKIPTIIIDIIPFVIVISTAFIYRYLINNNEIISLRNIGFSLLDIYKPIAAAIFFTGLLILFLLNPLSAKLENKFDKITTKDFSDQYSINIKNNKLWIKNIKNLEEKYFINISNIDLENMNAKNIKIISITKEDNYFLLSKKGKITDKQFNLNDVIILDIDNDEYERRKNLTLDLNFDKNNLINSISNYKNIPFYKYKEHLNSLKKFNLYSSKVSLFYVSTIINPFFLVIVGFTVMGFSGKFKKNESFFTVLFISILIGFLLFLLKEIITSLTITYNIHFLLSYLIIFSIPLIIGLYQIINIEIN